MKRIKLGVFRKSLWVMAALVSLLIAAGVEASAAMPEGLYLEVVVAPNHQPSVPCQLNNQGQEKTSLNPANGGTSDHAAHHPSVNGPGNQPVPITEAAWSGVIEELNDSQNELVQLMAIFDLNFQNNTLNSEGK